MPKGTVELIEDLRAEGIRDERVLQAVAATPREVFVEEGYERFAFADRALPIACGQTISQPYIVAYMTEALEIEPTMRVLEIGTGSGYQAAILARLAAEVFTVERHKPLLEQAKARFSSLGLRNIHTHHGDGYDGWPEAAPFARILVTAAFPELPQALIGQLVEGGILVAPVGYETLSQRLVKMIRTHDGVGPQFRTEPLLPVVFVPMVPGLPRGRDSGNS
jgi:protein-L-isoaspartate(D-aspartate) O-methyltransferase